MRRQAKQFRAKQELGTLQSRDRSGVPVDGSRRVQRGGHAGARHRTVHRPRAGDHDPLSVRVVNETQRRQYKRHDPSARLSLHLRHPCYARYNPFREDILSVQEIVRYGLQGSSRFTGERTSGGLA